MTPDGGPAFPPTNPTSIFHTGMSLRDWFAGQWLAGMLAGGQSFESPEMVAAEAFGVADAMLAERAKVQS